MNNMCRPMDLSLFPIRSLRRAGVALRARRIARKLSQKELGKMTGTAQSTISDVENGVVSVSLDVYLRLLEALGAELSAKDRQVDGAKP